jgi:hypothetical protein
MGKAAEALGRETTLLTSVLKEDPASKALSMELADSHRRRGNTLRDIGKVRAARVVCYLRAKDLSRGTRNEYLSTVRKWERWGGGIPRRATAAEGQQRVLGLGPRAGRHGWRYEPRPHGQHGPRAPPRRPLVGLGAGTHRLAAAVPEAQRALRRRRSALPDKG